jgi:hypothetical protein
LGIGGKLQIALVIAKGRLETLQPLIDHAPIPYLQREVRDNVEDKISRG